MSVHRFTLDDPEAAAEACAHHIAGLLEEALSGQEFATLAVSGGNTPRLLFQKLVASRFLWDRVHLFWVDERMVPPASARSNYKLAEDWLILPAHIPRPQVHRIYGELAPAHAAARYADEIREFFGLAPGELPHFDVIQRGMGADGHTASLFPGEPLIEDRERICEAVHVRKLGEWRVTLLGGVLLEARHTAVLAAGPDKAEAVRDVFQEPYDPMRFPAQIAAHHGRFCTWFLDKAAAALMD